MSTILYSTGIRNEVAKAGGKSYADALANCVIRLFGGTMPTSADDDEVSTHVIELTLDSGVFVAGESTNGINFDTATAGVLSKASGETWSGDATADETLTWGCIYDNSLTTGATTEGIRVMFDIGLTDSGAALEVEDQSVEFGNSFIVSDASLTIPSIS